MRTQIYNKFCLLYTKTIFLFLGPGKSSCWWYGSLDTKCNMNCVPCSTLPTECTSFFWDSFSINLKYDICDTYDDQGNIRTKVK